MIVLKFGGTSIGDADRMLRAIALVRERKQQSPAVVVSALGGVTDSLLHGGHLAVGGRQSGYESVIEELRQRHQGVFRALSGRGGKEREPCQWALDQELDNLIKIYHALSESRSLTPGVTDLIASFGEIFSSHLMVQACLAQGLDVTWVDPRDWLITSNDFGRAQPHWEETRERAQAIFVPILKRNSIPITGGFAGVTPGGVSTTLGRGGSDFSASILGVCLSAEEIQIWTDVDGMMTADPKLIPEAKLLEEISFAEASELAYFGAKVLHPGTIHPAMEAEIPVRILNALKPKVPGTRITAKGQAGDSIRAIAFKKGIFGITLTSARMLMAYGFLSSVFQIFEKYSTPIDLVVTSEVSVSLTVDDPRNLESVCKELKAFSKVEVQPDLAVISIVGRKFLQQQEVAARVLGALRRINILMISFGASDINLSFVVRETEANQAIAFLHHELLIPSRTGSPR